MLLDSVLYEILSGFRTHILIVLRDNNSGLMAECLRNSLYVYCSCDICTAVTDKYSYSLHILPSLLSIFSKCCNDSLLRQIFVEHFRDLCGQKMIITLLSYSCKSYSLHDLCRFNVSGTPVNAGKAGKTFVNRLGIHQGLYITSLDHVYELVRMIFHFIVGGTSA